MKATGVFFAAAAALLACAQPAAACALCKAMASSAHDAAEPEVYPFAEDSTAQGSKWYTYDLKHPADAAPTSSVPAFNSNPGAHAKLFLDFNGVNFGNTAWGGKYPGNRPAYDIDGDPSTFSSEELARIEQVWSRVAEAYSMFDLNVTTVDPGNYNRKESAHVVISGSSSDWYGLAGGVAYVGAFAAYDSNQMVRRTGWAFPAQLRVSSHGDPKTMADAAAHEAGHMFGLNHQKTYSSTGASTSEYDNNNGSELLAPTLGVSYNARRGLWSTEKTLSGGMLTDEMDRIAGLSNGFGYVDDEQGVSFVTAPDFSPSTTPLRGVIARNDDVDYYKIELLEDSRVDLLVDVAPYGPTLDARLMLYDSDYQLLADDDPTLSTSRASLTASFNGVLSAGVYYLGVASHGGYTYANGNRTRTLQDVGQYFLSGSIASAPEPAAQLALLLAVCASGSLRRRIG